MTQVEEKGKKEAREWFMYGFQIGKNSRSLFISMENAEKIFESKWNHDKEFEIEEALKIIEESWNETMKKYAKDFPFDEKLKIVIKDGDGTGDKDDIIQ